MPRAPAVQERVVGDSLTKTSAASQASQGTKDQSGRQDLFRESSEPRVTRSTASAPTRASATPASSTSQPSAEGTGAAKGGYPAFIRQDSPIRVRSAPTPVRAAISRESAPYTAKPHSVPSTSPFQTKTVADLKAIARHHGVSIVGCAEKPDLIEKLQAAGVADTPDAVPEPTTSVPAPRVVQPCVSTSTQAPFVQPCSGETKRHKTGSAQGKDGPRMRGVEMGKLWLKGRSFDPMQAALRAQLLGILGLQESVLIEAMSGHRGGQNEGVWFVRVHGQELVLKLVNGVSRHPTIPTEAENIFRISKEHPDIVNDRDIAFPHKVLRLEGCPGGKVYDLIIMRKASGLQLQQVISEKLYRGRHAELLAILELVGAGVAAFHRRYGNKQHCDLNAANIMFDESNGHVVLIDVGGMGDPTILAKDVDCFPKSIDLLTKFQDALGASQLVRHFQLGYTNAAVRH